MDVQDVKTVVTIDSMGLGYWHYCIPRITPVYAAVKDIQLHGAS